METLHLANISYLSHVRKVGRYSKLVQEICTLTQSQQNLCQYLQSQSLLPTLSIRALHDNVFELNGHREAGVDL